MADVVSEPTNRIKVVLRVRPPCKNEQDWFRRGEYQHIVRDVTQTSNPDTRLIVNRTGKSYDFDQVFREDSTQRQVFRATALPTLENVFAGYCGAVMAYGQTGTGKTHTMQGYPNRLGAEEKGIVPRCAEYIFNRIEKTEGTAFTVRLSFVQIYLDKLQDLFQPDAPEMMINPECERVELPGVTEHVATSAEQFMKLFYAGEKHRVTRATMMNETSSRGHAALLVHIVMAPKHDEQGLLPTKVGKLVLVDLAGYERFTLTGATGIAAEEAKKINASLLALGSVVNALADACSLKRLGSYHIPYRNAKLTRLLKDCLGGTSKSTVICTIGPCDKYSQETSGTLYFGWRAMAVKVDAKIQEVYDPAKYAQHLKRKLAEALDRVKTLAQVFKKCSPAGYEAYVQQFGEPQVSLDFTEDEEEAAIIAALNRLDVPIPTPARGAPALAIPGRERLRDMRAEAILDNGTLVDDPAAPEEVREVQKNWNLELRHQKEQAERELDMLRLRHLQDLEEAKAAGVDDAVLAQLREEHEQELRLVQEQNQLLKGEIQRQKQREEAAALLQSAKQANISELAGATSNGAEEGAGTAMQRQDDNRIGEICTHLQETCNSKDDILVRMFDLICYYEAQIQDHDINALAIVSTHATEVAAQEKVALSEARRREEALRRLLAGKEAELSRLRSGPVALPLAPTEPGRPLVRPVLPINRSPKGGPHPPTGPPPGSTITPRRPLSEPVTRVTAPLLRPASAAGAPAPGVGALGPSPLAPGVRPAPRLVVPPRPLP